MPTEHDRRRGSSRAGVVETTAPNRSSPRVNWERAVAIWEGSATVPMPGKRIAYVPENAGRGQLLQRACDERCTLEYSSRSEVIT